MAKRQYSRRAVTTGIVSVALCRGFTDRAHAQQPSSLKLGVANKAHLYYLPVTITDRRGHFLDYRLAVTLADFDVRTMEKVEAKPGAPKRPTGRYPEAKSNGVMPAYGLFARDVDGLTLRGKMSFKDEGASGREAMSFEGVQGLEGADEQGEGREADPEREVCQKDRGNVDTSKA